MLTKVHFLLGIILLSTASATDELSSQLPSHFDSFKELGIPSFDFNFKEKTETTPKPLSKGIEEDFGKLLKGDPVPGTGLKILARFLTEDDEDLKAKGGVYDETGFDGLVGGEEIFPEGTEARNRQRARSSALVYMKENRTEANFEAYGCTPDKEVLPNWLTYVVLLMNEKGEHHLLKICIPKSEGGMLAFALEPNSKCSDRVPLASEFADKSRMYLQKNSMSNVKLPFDAFIKNANAANLPPKPLDSDPPPAVSVKGEISKEDDAKNLQNKLDSLHNQLKDLRSQASSDPLSKSKESTPEYRMLKGQVDSLKSELSEIKDLLKAKFRKPEEIAEEKAKDEERMRQEERQRALDASKAKAESAKKTIETVKKVKNLRSKKVSEGVYEMMMKQLE